MALAESWINGASEVTSGGRHAVINPANQQTVAELTLGTPADVDRAVAAARLALRERATTPAQRCTVLTRLADLTELHTPELVDDEVRQTGKPLRLAEEFDVPGTTRVRIAPRASPEINTGCVQLFTRRTPNHQTRDERHHRSSRKTLVTNSLHPPKVA
ncbi:aldehyde dehydrogenase family protein [Mycobacterium stomatepiae]|uniref:aldehyde dehydrogenase family protein n=1 Tax=Mycobacterium stomatepiae TaxID=470076 RepID=UPI001E2B4CC6|nr:aldehyde dehydrogenase family protein [Mycobacterium stomatepiae]